MHNIRVFVHTSGRTTTTFAICGFHDALNFHFSDKAVLRPSDSIFHRLTSLIRFNC